MLRLSDLTEIAVVNGRKLIYLLCALALLFVALGESLPSHCSDECEQDCHETCDCINCLQHQLLAAELAPHFQASHAGEVRPPLAECSLSAQVCYFGIDHPPQNTV
ncbi:MAG: hypothetical protein ABIJ61_13150 [bacterium]